MAEPKRQKPKVTDERNAAHGSAAAGPAQSGVAAALRDARLSAGIDLHKAAESLRIRYPYLEAIEAGRFSDLPGTTYALGFVRAYAEFLGLDGKQMVRRFKEEGQGMSRHTALFFPEPLQEGRFPGGAVLVVALVLAAAVYGGWYYWEHREASSVAEVPPVPANLAGLVKAEPQAPQRSAASGPATASEARIEGGVANTPGPPTAGASRSAAAPTTESTAAAGGAPAIIVAPPPPVAPLLAVAPPPSQPAGAPPPAAAPTAETEPAEAASSAEPEPSENAAESAPAAAGEPADSSAPEQAAALPSTESHVHGASDDGSRITLEAKLDSWIEVRDASGKVLWSRLLRAGDSYRVPNQPGLVLQTGNAGGLEVIIDGKPAPALGPVGVVRRNIRLDPARLGAGAAARP